MLLSELPSPPTHRLAVKVKPAAERAIRQQHPWVYEGSITKLSGEPQLGSIAIVFDKRDNRLMAVGLYDPFSPIRLKLLAYASARIDSAWFTQKIKVAHALRAPLLADGQTNSYRLVYGENDGLPSLIADVYDHVLVLKLYSFIWLPYLELLLPGLLEASGCGTVVLRLSRQLQARPDQLHGLQEGQCLVGTLPNPEVAFMEHGLCFSAHLIKGHKTGYFLDHRHNRKKVGLLSRDRRVLDVFSYAGGFSVHAMAGGAKEVISLDISAQAQAMAQRNIALNFGEGANHRVIVADAFEGMKELYKRGERFGLIVVDPPSFAKREAEIEGALVKYQQLARWAMLLAEPGGILVLASCSSRVSAEDFFEATSAGLASTGRPHRLLERTDHDVDHPVGFPEGAYLKTGYYEVVK